MPPMIVAIMVSVPMMSFVIITVVVPVSVTALFLGLAWRYVAISPTRFLAFIPAGGMVVAISVLIAIMIFVMIIVMMREMFSVVIIPVFVMILVMIFGKGENRQKCAA